MNTLPAVLQLDLSVLFTALAWGLGFFLAVRRVYLFQTIAIGCIVCLSGYTVASLSAPPWLVVPSLILLDILLAWYVLRKPAKIAVAYAWSWVFYFAFHVALSFWLRCDWLIPAWKLHA